MVVPDHGIEYRDYQMEAMGKTLDYLVADTKSALVVMPTGTGKTVLAGMFVEEFSKAEEKTLFLAHREVLINQALTTMQRFGFDCAVEMAGQDAQKAASILGCPDVVIGTVQSLTDDRLLSWDPTSFDFIIIDECHRALANSYTKIINHFDRAKVIGITATPRRGDGRNLGSRFQVKAFEYSLMRAIEERWLVPITVRTCPVSVDLRGLKVSSNGDYLASELGERIGPLVEGLARSFWKEIGDRTAVAFLPDVGSAMAFANVLSLLGCSTRYVAGSGGKFGMKKTECKKNLKDFNEGAYQVIVCCEILIEGWDCPRVEAVGILRPTNQQYRFMQMIGRGTRPSPDTGKTRCLVIDYDWQADPDVKELCSIIDIFDDGSLDDDVFAVARQIVKERAVDTDPIEIIEQAQKIVRTRKRFMIHLTGKELQYQSWDHDPVGVAKILDLGFKRKYDLDCSGINPATSRQIAALRHFGVKAPESLSKWGASKILGKLFKRREQGLASFGQVQYLMTNGVSPTMARDMTADSAAEAIRQISSAARQTQGELF